MFGKSYMITREDVERDPSVLNKDPFEQGLEDGIRELRAKGHSDEYIARKVKMDINKVKEIQ